MKNFKLIILCIIFSAGFSYSQYLVNFEGAGETKTAYASGTVSLSGINWDLTEVLIGTDASDFKNGLRSARLRGYGTSIMSMYGTKSNGIGTITFYYRRYGTDVQVDWKVEYCVNNDTTNWIQIGSSFTAPASDVVQNFNETVNVSGNIRIRIKRATESGTINRRLNIDDINITDYIPGGTPSIAVNPNVLSGFSYVFGSGPSVSQSYLLSGTNLNPSSGNLTATAPTNYEVSKDNVNFSSSVNYAYSGGSLSDTTVYVRLIAGLSVGSYSGAVGNTGGGVVTPVNVNISGVVIKSEPTNHPTGFSASLGSPSYSSVTVTWTDANTGVTPDGYLIKGSDVGYNNITAPADGVPESNGTLVRNVIQGTQTYTFTLLNANTTYYFKIFPYTNSGSSINYKTDGTIQQSSVTTNPGPAMTTLIFPQFIQGNTSTNTTRVPFAYRATLSGLLPNATYRFINQVVNYADGPAINGAGNCIFVNADSSFVRTASPSFLTVGQYGEFTTNGSGSFTGWFVTEPTGNARFTPGAYISMRIRLNDGAGGTTAVTYLTSSDSVRVINFGAANDPIQGTGIYGNSNSPAKEFVFLYDNLAGTGRPLAGTFIESEGTDNTTANSYVLYYNNNVNGVTGAWGTIIPNQLTNGVRRIERRTLSSGDLYPVIATDADGVWPGGANTVNPTGSSSTPLVILNTDAPLKGNILNLTALIEGLYNNVTDNMISDTVTVEFRNTSSPYGLVESQKTVLNTVGQAQVAFTTAAELTNYYLVIKHRNALETWSSSPVQFTGGVLNYNFTTSASQSYGNNMIQKGSKWCLYSGDANHDGQISLDDLLMIDTDNQNFETGYLVTDVNGDGQVTLDDLLVTDSNNQNFISVQKPGGFLRKVVNPDETGLNLLKKIDEYRKIRNSK